MPADRDLYEILGVSRTASADEIKSAHRRLARQHHPDLNKEEGAAARFNEIQTAYGVLSDPEKRQQYDRFGHAGVEGGGTGPGSPGGPGGPGAEWQNISPEDFESIFGEAFGGRASQGRGGFGGFGGFGGQRTAGPTKGRDLEHDLKIGFATAAFGGSERLALGSSSGAPAEIDVKIPPGIGDGATLRVRGKGLPGTGGGPDGDLLLQIRIGRHPWFIRDGLDLEIEVPITIVEATLGGEIRVPLLKGTATLKVPPGVRSGARLRLKGRGITDAEDRTGDLHAVLQITAPKVDELDEQDRVALDRIAERTGNPRFSTPWAGEIADR